MSCMNYSETKFTRHYSLPIQNLFLFLFLLSESWYYLGDNVPNLRLANLNPLAPKVALSYRSTQWEIIWEILKKLCFTYKAITASCFFILFLSAWKTYFSLAVWNARKQGIMPSNLWREIIFNLNFKSARILKIK